MTEPLVRVLNHRGRHSTSVPMVTVSRVFLSTPYVPSGTMGVVCLSEDILEKRGSVSYPPWEVPPEDSLGALSDGRTVSLGKTKGTMSTKFYY